jgi:hypothetical protein
MRVADRFLAIFASTASVRGQSSTAPAVALTTVPVNILPRSEAIITAAFAVSLTVALIGSRVLRPVAYLGTLWRKERR